MDQFQITWVKDPIEDILGIGSLDLHCEVYCVKRTPDTCGFLCEGHATT